MNRKEETNEYREIERERKEEKGERREEVGRSEVHSNNKNRRA